jgi:RES domain-containing protein
VKLPRISAPQPTYRLIPSQYPPIGLFDTVTRAADLEAVMELAGWTNDRLVAERLARLPPSDWVFGRSNASIVMAAFLHAAPDGGRFNGPDLGAWYASARVETAIAEVAHHLRRETLARRKQQATRRFRAYNARLEGRYCDLTGGAPAGVLAPDSYSASQTFGESLRKAGEAGIVYPSLRHEGGLNVAAYRPGNVVEVTQADHFDISVSVSERPIEVKRLTV